MVAWNDPHLDLQLGFQLLYSTCPCSFTFNLSMLLLYCYQTLVPIRRSSCLLASHAQGTRFFRPRDARPTFGGHHSQHNWRLFRHRPLHSGEILRFFTARHLCVLQGDPCLFPRFYNLPWCVAPYISYCSTHLLRFSWLGQKPFTSTTTVRSYIMFCIHLASYH
jgi:hypothetical protein